MTEEPLKCSRCGFENPPGMRFCGGCGTALAVPAGEEERKVVAILFADICDFTAIVARTDPEETKEKVDACLRELADEVVSYGGVVEKFIGDAVMAVFGIPRAHDNDAERAVRAGLAMLDSVRAFGAHTGFDVQLRIGVHFGEAIVSAPDELPGHGHGVFGDTVNIASRAEDTGIPGAVVVTAAVFAKTKTAFDFEKLPAVTVKGISRPLARYRVAGEKAGREKFRGIPGLAAPMIGRDRELAQLLEAYRAVAAAEGARVVAAVGEAGIGKTRLSEEFAAALEVAGAPPRVLHGRCLGYAGAPAYYPFTEIIKTLADVRDDTPLEEARRRVGALAEAAFGGPTIGAVDAVAVLLEMLAMQTDGLHAGGRDSEQIRDHVRLVVERLLAALSRAQPLMVRVEDVHWADAATADLVEHLARALGPARCLLLLNSRPPTDYANVGTRLLGRLASFANFALIELVDLSVEESRELVSQLLTIEKLPPDTRDFIIERAGGNPYFVEEVIKVLIERGLIVRAGDQWKATCPISEMDVPDSIGGVLRSRFDRLPRDEKKVAQRAAVVGRVFWRRVVGELMQQQIGDNLAELERRDFIRQRLQSLFEEDLEYVFKHALLHETVYNTMLRKVRRELHLKAADWIEVNYSDRLDAYLSLVGYHYEMGGHPEKAADYYYRAAARASSLFANDDAKNSYAKVVDCGVDGELLLRAFKGWGDVCARTADYEDAISHYESARAYVRTPLEEADLLRRVGDVYEYMSAYAKALEYFAWAEDVLEGTPPTLTLCWIYKSSGWVYRLQGNCEKALATARRAEKLLTTVQGEEEAVDEARAHVFNVLGATLADMERFDESREYFDRTLALYEKHGDLYGVGKALNNIGTTESGAGRLSSAVDYYSRSLDYDERIGNRFGQAISSYNLGSTYSDLGEYDKARELVEQYLKINAAIGNRIGDGYAYRLLAAMAEEEGRAGDAEELYGKSAAVYAEVGARGLARLARLDLAALYAAAGDGERARAVFDELRDEAPEDVCFAEALAGARLARTRPFDEREEKGYAVVAAEAEKNLDERFSVMGKLTYTAALSELYGELGDGAKSEKLRALAEELARRVEESVTSAELRASFRRRFERVIMHRG